MKKVSLTISERVASIALLNSFKGQLDQLTVILSDLAKIRISPEEWETAERKIDDSLPSPVWTWDDEKGGEKDIELEKETSEYLTSQIKSKDEKKDMTLADRPLVNLLAKLEKKD